MSKIVLPDLSYKVMSILFEVNNKLGVNFKEKHYQKAIENILREKHIKYQKELPANLKFENDILGKFYIDFIIGDGNEKLLLEVKATNYIHPDDIKQVLRYLNITKLKLGIIANFRKKPLEYKRIVNFKQHSG